MDYLIKSDIKGIEDFEVIACVNGRFWLSCIFILQLKENVENYMEKYKNWLTYIGRFRSLPSNNIFSITGRVSRMNEEILHHAVFPAKQYINVFNIGSSKNSPQVESKHPSLSENIVQESTKIYTLSFIYTLLSLTAIATIVSILFNPGK